MDDAAQSLTVPGTDVSLPLSSLSAQIATELAAGLSDAKGIRERYGVSSDQWDKLRVNPAFRRMVEEALQTWTGDLNAGQRITKKAEILLEDALPVLDTLAHSIQVPPETRINAIKQMESLTGRKAKDAANAQAGNTAPFVLNINIGEGRALTIEGTAEPVHDVA